LKAQRLHRHGLTIVKRPGPNGFGTRKFTCTVKFRRQTYYLTLAETAEPSFKMAVIFRRGICEGRVNEILAQTHLRSPHPAVSSVTEILARYTARARGVTAVKETTVRATANAVRYIMAAAGSQCFDADVLACFKQTKLEAAGDDQLLRARAAITINSYIRQARSLFAADYLDADIYKGLTLPDLPAVFKVKLLPEPPKRFQMPARELIQKILAAAPLLKLADTNAYIIFLLSVGGGMDKQEIAHARRVWLTKSDVGAQVEVKTEADFTPKYNRSRNIGLETWVYDELLAVTMPHVGVGPDYLLNGSPSERTDQAFRRFGAWLKQLGWIQHKKAHAMRKICGSVFAETVGLRAAQQALGHRNQKTTEAHYVGNLNVPRADVFGTLQNYR
jgi:integrase